MQTASDWMVVAGFFLSAAGVGLRVAMMMRASDAVSASGIPIMGRAAVKAFRLAHPKSRLPMLMTLLLSVGLILLVAGFLLEFR